MYTTIQTRSFLWRSATIHYIVMYTQIHPVTSLLKSTMKQTYYIQSPLRILKALPSEPKVSNTGGNCPCSEAKLPNRIFTNLQSKFGTFGPERKAFNAISYSSDQANAQNQVVQSLDLGKVSQTPRVRKRSFQDLDKQSLGLLCLAQVINNLEKQINCYQKYGLSSYLASCSTSLLSYKTYIATTVKEEHSREVTTLLPLIILTKNGYFQHLIGGEAFENKVLETFAESRTIKEFDSSINLSSYNLTKILDDELDTGGIRSSLKPSVLNAERLSKLNNEESTPIVSIPFKVTRDYTSGDASEGFED